MTVRRLTLSSITLTLPVGMGPAATLAASPAPGISGAVDTRTAATATLDSGPVEVLAGVVLLGLVTALVTASVARLARARSRS